jgi:hypothetical protein
MAPELSSVVVNGDFIGVTAAREDDNVVTLTTNGSSGFKVGNEIRVAGFSDAGYNGTWTIDYVGNNKVTFTCTNTGLPASPEGQMAPYALSDNSSSALMGSQRSMVDSVAYTFNTPVTLDSKAMSIALGTPTTAGQASLASGLPNLNVTSLDDGSVWVVTFSSSDSARVLGHSIADGVYKINIDGDHVSAVDGGAALTSGQTDIFYRLYGDITGFNTSARVNNEDSLKYTSAAQTRIGDAAYVAALDFNGDGRINNLENLQFSNHYLTQWTDFAPTI